MTHVRLHCAVCDASPWTCRKQRLSHAIVDWTVVACNRVFGTSVLWLPCRPRLGGQRPI